MEVKAKARFIRMAPRKVRLVANLVRGMDLSAAVAQLRFVKKAAARPVLKLIQSAGANAENNFKLNPGTLFIKTITVDGGPTLHRWRARAFGRAAAIRKRMSHITVILEERGLGGAKDAAAAVVKAPAKKAPAKKAAPKAAKKTPAKKAATK
jgi:large subunit ribosomal protein L22